MQFLFFNNSGLLRSGWRVAAFILAFIVISLTLGAGAQLFFLSVGIDAALGSSTFLATNGVLSLISALFVGWLCGRFFERLPFRALGAWFSNGWLTHWLVGLVAGAGTLSIAVLIASLFDGLRFTASADSNLIASLAISLSIFAAAAAFEEVVCRGYILQTLARSNLTWLGILLTSVFFGLAHLANPSASIISTVNTVLAGVWFGVAYLKTRDLWFPWAIHMMWNWTQGSIFGIEVSGLSGIGGPSLLTEIDAGPTWLTGETYGIEGGIASAIAILISIVAIQLLPLKPDAELLRLTTPPES
jgi:membrane protease YdiL (CAAX protease family)